MARSKQDEKGKGDITPIKVKLSTKKTMTVKSKIPSLWQLLIQLKAKMMGIMNGAWKGSKTRRSTRRADKKAALKIIMKDYYIMDPGVFL